MNEFRLFESNRHMPNAALTTADVNALIAERDVAVAEREALRGELKVVKVERDLLKESKRSINRATPQASEME